MNEETSGNAYPLTDMTEILDQLGQIVMWYHQSELMTENKNKTVFGMKQGIGQIRRCHLDYKQLQKLCRL
jgi:hypothetical protein